MTGGFHWIYSRWQKTILNDLWLELWFFCSFAAGICAINSYTKYHIELAAQKLMTVLGLVIGLVISFRTNSANDRYWEGRKLWGNIALASRNLGLYIWIHVPLSRAPKGKKGEAPKEGYVPPPDEHLRGFIERKTMINLVQAYSIAVKHYLRSEPGIFYEDLYPLLSFLPQSVDGAFFPQSLDGDPRQRIVKLKRNQSLRSQSSVSHHRTTSQQFRQEQRVDPESLLPMGMPTTVPLGPSANPPSETLYERFPPLLVFKPFDLLWKKLRQDRRGVDIDERELLVKKTERPTAHANIPLEISMLLMSYHKMLLDKELLSSTAATGYSIAMAMLQDAVTGLERIRMTPIPYAYQIHLRLAIWVYLLFLPMEVHSAFGWFTIPCTAFAVFLYLGFLEIGSEIENPFNYDRNDLDLDFFCLQIQRELAEITAHPVNDPSAFIFSQWNQPFAPSERRSAAQILQDREDAEIEDGVAVRQVKQTLLHNYLEIGEAAMHRGVHGTPKTPT